MESKTARDCLRLDDFLSMMGSLLAWRRKSSLALGGELLALRMTFWRMLRVLKVLLDGFEVRVSWFIL